MILTKPITFCVRPDVKRKNEIYALVYPEIEKMCEEGWTLSETLPAWGTGNDYFITFIMQVEVERVKKKLTSRKKGT